MLQKSISVKKQPLSFIKKSLAMAAAITTTMITLYGPLKAADKNEVEKTDTTKKTEEISNSFISEVNAIYALEALAALIVLGFSIKGYLELKKKDSPQQIKDFLNELQQYSNRKVAINELQKTKALINEIAVTALQNLDSDREMFNEKIQLILDRYEDMFQHNPKVTILALVATITPMLGFIGTVSGMEDALLAFNLNNGTKVLQIAEGIGNALKTTKYALWITVPATVSYLMLFAKQARMASNIETLANRIHTYIKHLKE